ncbi:helix-turn-helix domain-containing protein [Pedobacter sp. UYP1]|uniref:AraC family transcriptional regulator n=1 Tax=Pedobacter sp. UYP1 TaxID=1756396 RepID=UPI003391CB5C
MIFENASKEFLCLMELNNENKHTVFDFRETDKTLIWNTGDFLNITVDKVPYQLSKNELIFLTEFHKIDDIGFDTARMVRFNKSFFCMIDQDNQVGSKGLLFYGAAHIQIVKVDITVIEDFEASWEIFYNEMQQEDILQKEMLETMLKRMLILSVRILRKSTYLHQLEKSQVDIIREFNFLVESHFYKHHDVAFYASKLNKSPKTLSNLFSNTFNRSPLGIIHDRIMIHARRQIDYTSFSIKEIAHQLGYKDIQTFSRFFRNKEGISPAQYREKHTLS